MKKKRKRILSILLIMSLIFSMIPNAAHASYEAEGICEHHVAHTTECGYTETVSGQECIHVHDEVCGYASEEGVTCDHIHDEYCGYSETVEGTKCTYECIECAGLTNDGQKKEISYLEYEWDETKKELATQNKTASDYTILTEDIEVGIKWKGTYYICEDVTIDAATTNHGTYGAIDCEGDVTLIIAPGKTLTIQGNLENKKDSITIYGQEDRNGAKGKLVINHESSSNTALKAGEDAAEDANIIMHGINLEITNKTSENGATVGPAIDVISKIKIYNSTLNITSDSTALYAKDVFCYGSNLEIMSPAALSARDSINLYYNVLDIKGKTQQSNAFTGMLAPDILLENCTGSITADYGQCINATESLEICGRDTDLAIEIFDSESGTAIVIPNHSLQFRLGEGLYIKDAAQNNIDHTNANNFVECNKLFINKEEPSVFEYTVTVNGVTLYNGNWLEEDATEPTTRQLDDNYAYLCDDVLTLKNFDGKTIQTNIPQGYSMLQIILEGTNTLTPETTTDKVCGISVRGNNLTIIGNGTLQITINSQGESTGLYCDQEIALYASATSVFVNNDRQLTQAQGVKAKGMTIANCNLTIHSGDIGINVNDTLRIFDGTLDIQGEPTQFFVRMLSLNPVSRFPYLKITRYIRSMKSIMTFFLFGMKKNRNMPRNLVGIQIMNGSLNGGRTIMDIGMGVQIVLHRWIMNHMNLL